MSYNLNGLKYCFQLFCHVESSLVSVTEISLLPTSINSSRRTSSAAISALSESISNESSTKHETLAVPSFSPSIRGISTNIDLRSSSDIGTLSSIITPSTPSSLRNSLIRSTASTLVSIVNFFHIINF